MRWLVLAISSGIVLQAFALRAQCPEYPAGEPDDFVLPTEPASPDAPLTDFIVNYLGHPVRDFDEGGINKTFGHTFTNLPADPCTATLEIRLRAEGEVNSNDTINLEFIEDFVPGVTSAFAWGLFIQDLVAVDWQYGATATLTLDLANLPPDPHGRTSVMSAFGDGEFDVVVDDDTAVDYAVLRLCSCTVGVMSQTWSQVKSLYQK